MLSAGEASHMVRVISQRLDANSCGWEQCRKYTLCVKEWGRRPGEEYKLPRVLCTGFRMVPACLWPSEASYPKYLVSLEDGLEPPGGEEDKLPSLQAPPSVVPPAPRWNFRDWTAVPGAPSPTPARFFQVCGVWAVLIKVLGSSKKKKKDSRLNKNVLIAMIGSLELSYEHVSVLKYCWASLCAGSVLGTGNTILSKIESSHPRADKPV